jgi:RNA polymerase sigma-70 factor (ECF subfamily)
LRQRFQGDCPIGPTSEGTHFRGEILSIPPSTLDEGGSRNGASRIGSGDGELVARVLRGETEAYRHLVDRYQRAVCGLARRLLGPGGDHEDLAQDAMVRAYRYLGTLKDPDRFGPWLYQVTRSLFRDRNRRREAERKALERHREFLRSSAVPAGDGIGSALYRLEPEEYQALRMRYYEGQNYEEIARRMDKTFSQVDHLIRKARAHLARNLSREKARERSL